MIFCLAGSGSAFLRRSDRLWLRLSRFRYRSLAEIRGAVVDDLVVNLERGIALLLDSLEKSE